MAPLMRFLVPGRLIDYNHVIYLLFLGPQVGQTILGMPMFVTVIVGRQLSVPSSWSMAPLMRFLVPGQLIDYNHVIYLLFLGHQVGQTILGMPNQRSSVVNSRYSDRRLSILGTEFLHHFLGDLIGPKWYYYVLLSFSLSTEWLPTKNKCNRTPIIHG